ncbi:MAG: hypothetical protein HC866_02550 [Leptolyngbyaceae cyanobacterium RU_5_1]|nr:hypothetical protein [Leptolyngbyaceae cyanobacterium RU_5_1]
MDSNILARYIEITDGISKPWLLTQLRLKKLQEHRNTMTDADYEAALASIHADMMKLGEWWIGIEDEAFG